MSLFIYVSIDLSIYVLIYLAFIYPATVALYWKPITAIRSLKNVMHFYWQKNHKNYGFSSTGKYIPTRINIAYLFE